ncbi:MAG: TIGR00341 family protein [Anaerolineales bacterium]|nr:TIGR00341 family protein [Anaerolineales bacterium]
MNEKNSAPNLSNQINDFFSRIRTRFLHYGRKVIPPISASRRGEVKDQLHNASQPDFDFFVLVVLSCTIATSGLLINSPATIIGAMLVAPLMSPVLGVGFASLVGDTRMMFKAASALLRGALFAIVLSTALTLMNRVLPFVSLQELPTEVLSRTQPSPIDLVVALAGGMAAAFALVQPELSAALPGVAIATALMPPLCVVGIGLALGDWEVARGAFLLFLTNVVTIAASGIFVFWVMGFRPKHVIEKGIFPRSLAYSMVLMLVLFTPLAIQSYRFVTRASFANQISETVKAHVSKIPGAELVALEYSEQEDALEMTITIRSIQPLSFADSVNLQDAVSTDLQQPVRLVIKVDQAALLDPKVPPTFTSTMTPGPTFTPTLTLEPDTPTPTPSPVPSDTPTLTPTLLPTPVPAWVVNTGGAYLPLRDVPEGNILAYLSPGDQVNVMDQQEIVNGMVWVPIITSSGDHGWTTLYNLEMIAE